MGQAPCGARDLMMLVISIGGCPNSCTFSHSGCLASDWVIFILLAFCFVLWC